MPNPNVINYYSNCLVSLTAVREVVPDPRPLNVSPWVAMSLLQKAIRRGDAPALLRDAPERMWRRLGCIAFEDIGVADIVCLGLVTTALTGKAFRKRLGGKWAVASLIIQCMAEAPKNRSADDLLMTIEGLPSLTLYRDDFARLSDDQLRQIVLGCSDLHKRGLALWYLVGTKRCPSPNLTPRPGNVDFAFEVLAEHGVSPSMTQIARQGFRKTGEILAPLTALLTLVNGTRGDVAHDDIMPVARHAGEVLSYALDTYTREGKQTIARFLKTNAGTTDWILENLPKRGRSAFLGESKLKLRAFHPRELSASKVFSGNLTKHYKRASVMASSTSGSKTATSSGLRSMFRLRRRFWLVIAPVLAFTGIIIFGITFLFGWTVNRAVGHMSEREALRWATAFQTTTTDIDSILNQDGELHFNDAQENVMLTASTYGDIFRFVVFNLEGESLIVWDLNGWQSGYNAPSSTALNVISANASDVSMHDGTSRTDRPDHYVEVYLPLYDDSGQTFGAMEVYLDKTDTINFFLHAFRFVIFGLPLACVLIYLIPALGFLHKANEARVRAKAVDFLANYDSLTGLSNRAALNDAFSKQIDNRPEDESVGMLFMDADNFKWFNDEYGHKFGDEVLCHIAGTLLDEVRSGDFVARMGGDEFVAILPNVTAEDLVGIAEGILSAVRQTLHHDGQQAVVKLSIGAHIVKSGQTSEEALHAADMALYEAKSRGRNMVVLSSEGIENAITRRRFVEAALRVALADKSLEVNYQQLTAPRGRQVVGFEALCRLRDCDNQLISPLEFIPIAESTGMIHELGMQVLEAAIETARTWPDHIFVSVNFSAAQFVSGNLVADVKRVLERTEFDARRLECEVTESTFALDEDHVAGQIKELKALGLSIAMDDFGTGYSSLGYLWKYDFDKIKIDRAFLLGLEANETRHRDIIETIVVLGHKMGMDVTIEGVETIEQLNILEQMDCSQYQGFYFGRPVCADETLRAFAPMEQRKTA